MKPNRYLNNIDSFIAAAIGFYAIHLFTKYSGVGISPDSIMYASTATNIQAHWSLITFNKTPLVFFPVFYPFFLSIIQFVSRVDPITAGPIINGLLFAAVIFTSGWIMSKFIGNSRVYKWLILTAIILSPGLLEVYSYLWSETLFILEILIFVIAYWWYMQTHTIKALVVVGVVTAISCITRYAGVTIIGTGGLMLLLDNQLAIRKKIGHILLYGTISISLLVSNLILNSLSTGLSTGTREPSITPFIKNMYYFGRVICDWGSLSKGAIPYAAIITAIIVIALIILLLLKALKGKINSYENIIIAFAIVYGLFIVISASISRYERINSRLISPMFIALLIGCTSWVPDVLKNIRSKSKYALAGVAVVLMLAFEYTTFKVDYQRYDDESDYGVPGYSDDDWNKSKFVVFLRNHKKVFKPDIPIFTDANEAVYIFSRMPSEVLPHRYFKKDVEKFYTHNHFYLIWFNKLDNPELISLTDIMKEKKLTMLYKFDDGAIYECGVK